MLQKIDTRFLATVLLVALTFAVIFYYIEELFFPGYVFSLVFSQLVGLMFFALITAALTNIPTVICRLYGLISAISVINSGNLDGIFLDISEKYRHSRATTRPVKV